MNRLQKAQYITKSIEIFTTILATCLPNKRKPLLCKGFKFYSAESEGFEPSIQFPVYTLSRRAPSTTRTTLLFLKERKLTTIA